jgi:hypothetical protein
MRETIKPPKPPVTTITPWNPSRRATARVTDSLPVPKCCPHCGGEVWIGSNSHIYGREYGEWPWVVMCRSCDAYVGLHPFTGIPLGTLATHQIRQARKAAKAAFNPLWESGGMTRSEAYSWLAHALQIPVNECHIGWLDAAQCYNAIRLITLRK